MEGDKLFGVERYDLDVLVIYFVVLAVFFHILLLEILYYEVKIVIFLDCGRLWEGKTGRCHDVSG